MAANKLSRRAFLRSVVGGVAAGGLALGSSRIAAAIAEQPAELAARYALIIDTTKCTGCGACQTACQIRNHLPPDSSFIHILSRGEATDRTFMPIQCQHCADAPCKRVCPTRATYRTGDGVVMVKEKLCVGCRYCELACPYQARIFDEERGIADKCWLCLDYVEEGKNPACVDACVWGARIFGRQDDANSQVAQLIASGVAKPLHPEFGTKPSILYYIM